MRIFHKNITRKPSKFRECLSPEKVLAIGLYRLATGASWQACADVFNVGKTTALEAFEDVLSALNKVKGHFIKFPSTLEEN